MKTKKAWWETQYRDSTLTEIIFGWPTETTSETDQMLRQLKLRPGARILDLACGRGRHSVELARRGFQVTGLDYSPLLLSQARAASQALPESRRPLFVQGDMRQLLRIFSRESFDAVVNLCNSWGYFDRRSDDQKVLKAIAHILAPGGSLVINTLNEPGLIHSWQGHLKTWREEPKDRYFLQESTYDPVRKKLSSRWIVLAPKERLKKSYSFAQNVYSPSDFRTELNNAGLRMARLWGTLGGARYSKYSWHQSFVARKVDKGA